jgi:protein-ribulosamine 3-kinase
MNAAIAAALTHAIGTTVQVQGWRAVGGGSIHSAFRVPTVRECVFVKVGPLSVLPMLTAEAQGLAAIQATQAIRVPSVLALGEAEQQAYLCLEWLDLHPASGRSHALLGEQLAVLHRVHSDRFGFSTDNFIGSTPQANAYCATWTQFFRERRLQPQLELAASNGADAHCIDRGRALAQRLDALLDTRPLASLVHGDLWGGNWGVTADGAPVIFDPAVYHGDRETDLAMTRLFGGFDAAFYAAYEAVWPLPAGARTRFKLYNLYHVLNHYNLFGGGYLAQARTMIEQLLAHTGH